MGKWEVSKRWAVLVVMLMAWRTLIYCQYQGARFFAFCHLWERYNFYFFAHVRFAEDERMKEVCRLLRSSKTHLLKVERSPEATDVSHRYKQQLRLLSICRRSLALSVGRGMLTLSSLDPLMAEHLPIPLLSLAGFICHVFRVFRISNFIFIIS
jgi:hypothetical protein